MWLKNIKPYSDLFYLYVIKKTLNHTKVYAIFMWLKNIKSYKDLYYLYVIK